MDQKHKHTFGVIHSVPSNIADCDSSSVRFENSSTGLLSYLTSSGAPSVLLYVPSALSDEDELRLGVAAQVHISGLKHVPTTFVQHNNLAIVLPWLFDTS